MPQTFSLPNQVAIINGEAAPGAVLRFYQTGTNTPQFAYTNADLTAAVLSVAADSSGVFQKVYLNPSAEFDYRITLEDGSGVITRIEDDISPLPFSRADVGHVIYPASDAENAEGITPTDFAYPPGHIRRYGAAGDNSTDDSLAFQHAFAQLRAGGDPIVLDAGTFLVTSQLIYTLPDPTTTQQPALIMRGAGMYRSIIKSSAAEGSALKVSITDDSVMFQNGCVLSDFSLIPSGTPANQHGLQLAGVYGASIHRLQIEGFTGHGIYAPLLDSSFSGGPDYYSVVFVEINQCQINNNTKHGIWSEMGAAFIISCRNTAINHNDEGGVYMAGGGACEFAGGSISYNGTDGNGYGGMTLARSTGSFAAATQTTEVSRVEFDRNRNYHVRVGASSCAEFRQNRFIGADEVATTAHVPPTHVKFTLVTSGSDGDIQFVRNFHRRTDSTYAVTTYDLGNDANVSNIRLIGNRWASTSNTTKYANIHTSTRAQIEDNGVIARTNLAGSFARGRITSGSPTVGTSVGDIVWSSETTDNNSALDTATGIYTCPATGVYAVSIGLSITGLADNDTVTLRLVHNSGGDFTAREGEYEATGNTNFRAEMNTLIQCLVGDTLRVRALNSAGSKSIRVGDPYNWFAVQLLPQ